MTISYIRDIRRKVRSTDFGQAIREWRVENKMTGMDLSRLSGVEPSLISRYESGERVPTIGRAKVLAQAMYADDEVAQERFINFVGYTMYRDIMDDPDIKSFADLLTRGNIPEEYKDSARAMVRSLVRLANGHR